VASLFSIEKSNGQRNNYRLLQVVSNSTPTGRLFLRLHFPFRKCRVFFKRVGNLSFIFIFESGRRLYKIFDILRRRQIRIYWSAIGLGQSSTERLWVIESSMDPSSDAKDKKATEKETDEIEECWSPRFCSILKIF
jgi:hypothetical protein